MEGGGDSPVIAPSVQQGLGRGVAGVQSTALPVSPAGGPNGCLQQAHRPSYDSCYRTSSCFRDAAWTTGEVKDSNKQKIGVQYNG